MPSHIVVNSLGLTYKGTIGISIATIPDVCKTPSPGGPIPLPYPNFANQGTLRNGTTTVFAKGGKMIAVKGSQYGMSSGDEPGTVGGVKSNTFKQATDWITYSFDVKMDGKNACRHTDKKFHNNKNTVNLSGNVDPGFPGSNALVIDCKNAPASASKSKKFSRCDKQEICAKCAIINERMRSKKKNKPYLSTGLEAHTRLSKAKYRKLRKIGNAKCQSLNNAAKSGKPANIGFYDVPKACKEALQKKATTGKKYKNFSADHISELQIGGHPTDGMNLKWMSRGPNRWIGGQMKKFKADKDSWGSKAGGAHTGIAPNCCKDKD